MRSEWISGVLWLRESKTVSLGHYSSRLFSVMVLFPLASIATTSTLNSSISSFSNPLASSTNSFGTVTCVAEAGRLILNSNTRSSSDASTTSSVTTW